MEAIKTYCLINPTVSCTLLPGMACNSQLDCLYRGGGALPARVGFFVSDRSILTQFKQREAFQTTLTSIIHFVEQSISIAMPCGDQTNYLQRLTTYPKCFELGEKSPVYRALDVPRGSPRCLLP
jgi:hypothetical protein